MSDQSVDLNHYIDEQLTKAVLDLVRMQGDIRSRLTAAYVHRISVLHSPRARFPSDLQARFDQILDRLGDGGLSKLTVEECSEVASEVFSLWHDYERRFGT